MFTTILFDIDGTIIDTESVIISSLQEALSQITGRNYSASDLRFSLGIPSGEALNQLDLTAEQREQVKKVWPAILQTKQRQVTVFATMRRTLAHLQHRGVQLGIITSKNNVELENEFTWFGLNDYFDVIITADAEVAPKPSPEPIQLALTELGAKPAESMYLGDSVYDLQSAKAAGVSFGVATWGAYDLERFKQADYMLTRPEGLLDLAVIR